MLFNDPFSSSPLEQIAFQFGQVYFTFNLQKKQFVYANPALEKLVERPPAEILNNPAILLEYLHPEDQEYIRAEYQLVLEGNVNKKLECRLLFPDKTVKYLSVAIYTYYTEAGNNLFVGGYAEDITQQKEYLHNILEFNAKKNATLEILSHDLAGPFSNIQSLIEILEEKIRDKDGELQQVLDHIRENARMGSDMIHDFVDNEFLESSQVVLHKKRIDIVQRITTVLENYQQQADLISKKFTLKTNDQPIYLNLDEMKFIQVINNLISNAIKFTKDNGQITVTIEEQPGSVLIQVADDGIGIPEKFQDCLFDRFTKARRPGIRGQKTTGLGMSIIKLIVELHQGKIWFKSQENQGATFFVQVPTAGNESSN